VKKTLEKTISNNRIVTRRWGLVRNISATGQAVEHETHRQFQETLEHKSYADAKRILKDFEQWCKETTASDKADICPPPIAVRGF